MSKYRHNVRLADGSTVNDNESVLIGALYDVANAAGGAAGAAVTTAVAMQNLPAKYAVHVTPNQDAVAYVTGKSATGFNVVLNPRLAANTLAAGTFDVTVTAL